MNLQLTTQEYETWENEVHCEGYSFCDGTIFDNFMNDEVSSRLKDNEGKKVISDFLNSLALTDFGQDSIKEILEAERTEFKSWEIGEAIAESWLEKNCSITWPWNTERDKKTPFASLPGADLVGFVDVDSHTEIAIGEVKTSYDINCPPNVMTGRSGMIKQLENIADDLSIVNSLLTWLMHRCINTEFELKLHNSIVLFLNSGNKALSLFGVLIRDTKPSEKDITKRGKALSKKIDKPTSCSLIAVYLPCKIDDLNNKISVDYVI